MGKKYLKPSIILVFSYTDVIVMSTSFDEETGDYIGDWMWGD